LLWQRMELFDFVMLRLRLYQARRREVLASLVNRQMNSRRLQEERMGLLPVRIEVPVLAAFPRPSPLSRLGIYAVPAPVMFCALRHKPRQVLSGWRCRNATAIPAASPIPPRCHARCLPIGSTGHANAPERNAYVNSGISGWSGSGRENRKQPFSRRRGTRSKPLIQSMGIGGHRGLHISQTGR